MEISIEDTKLCFICKSWVVERVNYDYHLEIVQYQNKKGGNLSYQKNWNVLNIKICFISIINLVHHVSVPSKFCAKPFILSTRSLGIKFSNFNAIQHTETARCSQIFVYMLLKIDFGTKRMMSTQAVYVSHIEFRYERILATINPVSST
jgi:hypothetical protein